MRFSGGDDAVMMPTDSVRTVMRCVSCIFSQTIVILLITTTFLPLTPEASNSTGSVSFTAQSDMTREQNQSAVTIEFILGSKNETEFNDEKYQRILRAILYELNRRPRLRRRPRQLVTTEAAGTTETGTVPIYLYFLVRRRRRDVDFDYLLSDDDTGDVTTMTCDGREIRVPYDRDYEYYCDESDDYYTEDDLQLIVVDPAAKDDLMRVAVALDKLGEVDIDDDVLYAAVQALHNTNQLENEASMEVERVYKGLPNGESPSTESSTSKSRAALDWRFVVAFVLVIICFIIILLLVVCVRRHHRRHQPHPADDADAVDEQVLLPVTKNPDGQLPVGNGRTPADYDDGFIVPYDVMVEVQKSKNDATMTSNEATRL